MCSSGYIRTMISISLHTDSESHYDLLTLVLCMSIVVMEVLEVVRGGAVLDHLNHHCDIGQGIILLKTAVRLWI